MILASDFDDTLFVSNINIINKNIESIKKFRNLGNKFVIITGRGNSIYQYINQYKIPYDYLICENGSMIYDHNNKVISSTFLDQKDIEKIVSIIKRDHLNYIFDTGKEYIKKIDSNQNLVAIFLDKKTISDSPKLLEEILEKTNTYSYISTNWINIVNKNINKKLALKKLDELLNHKYKIYTIGDAINDIDMITTYNGAVMKKHEKELDALKNKNYETLSDYIEELI